jgi:hypothetical protein
MPVEDGQPGEIDVCDGHDGHSHHYVPTSVWECEHLHVRLLGQALGLMLHKAGVTNPGMALTGPQLVLAAESYLGVRVEVSADE